MKLNKKQPDRLLHVEEAEGGDGCYLRCSERVRSLSGSRPFRWEAQVIDLSEDELQKLIEWAFKRKSSAPLFESQYLQKPFPSEKL